MYYLPVAPDIDEPEGDVIPGYEQVKASGKGNSLPTASGEPPSKKTKITDVDINGEIYDPNSVHAGK